MIELDYHQHQCPYPVVETRKQLLANPAATVAVLVGDQTARENISRLAGKMGYQVSETKVADNYQLTLTPGAQMEPTTVAAAAIGGKTVIFCGCETMGDGDPDLGRILLKNFLVTLTELEVPPDAILFVNAGVKLACQGSEALEALTALACRGVDIAACGLCLDFYHLKEKLQVGRTTNMLEIAETTLLAGRVFRP